MERSGPDPERVRETMQEEREEIEEAGDAEEVPGDEGPDTAELDRDPAYEPDDEELKRLKGA
jgi:hypothetical protein